MGDAEDAPEDAPGWGEGHRAGGWGEGYATVSWLAGMRREVRFRRALLNRGWITAFDFARQVRCSIHRSIVIQITLKRQGMPPELAQWVARECETFPYMCVQYTVPVCRWG